MNTPVLTHDVFDMDLFRQKTRKGRTYTNWGGICDNLLSRNKQLIGSINDYETKYNEMKTLYEETFQKLEESLQEIGKLRTEVDKNDEFLGDR